LGAGRKGDVYYSSFGYESKFVEWVVKIKGNEMSPLGASVRSL
jgi:hypothetical protein